MSPTELYPHCTVNGKVRRKDPANNFLAKDKPKFVAVAMNAVFFCTKTDDPSRGSAGTFDVKMLEFLACPLSKKPLRFDAVNNELVCDEIGVAYVIKDGIPNLNPHDGRILNKSTQNSKDLS